jgi:hypothetical protein
MTMFNSICTARRPACVALTALLAASLACDPASDEDSELSATDEGGSSGSGELEDAEIDEDGHPTARPIGPAAPASDEPTGPVQPHCGAGERCLGAVPEAPMRPRNFAHNGKHTRGANSQLAIPQSRSSRKARRATAALRSTLVAATIRTSARITRVPPSG